MVSHVPEVHRVLQEIVPSLNLHQQARILVLADASAAVCTSLSSISQNIQCCPDFQRVQGKLHPSIAYPSVAELLHDDTYWDAVILASGSQRLRETNPPERFRLLLEWLAAHAGVVILEAPRKPLAPDLHDLGPYDVVDLLDPFTFVTEVASADEPPFSMSRPLLVASKFGAYVNGSWLHAGEVTPAAINPDRPVQTFLIDGTVLKIERSSEDDFRHSALRSEAAFLTGVNPASRAHLDLPMLTSLHRGRAVNALTRTAVPGDPLAPGCAATHEVPIGAVVSCAARWASAGLFHNDLRPWNLLWDGSSVRLIDYADSDSRDRDGQELPQILAFAMTVASLCTDEIPFGEDFLPAAMDLAREAGILDRWPVSDQVHGPWLRLPTSADVLIDTLEKRHLKNGKDVMSTVVEIAMSEAGHGRCQ
jgi:hypothetical protein